MKFQRRFRRSPSLIDFPFDVLLHVIRTNFFFGFITIEYGLITNKPSIQNKNNEIFWLKHLRCSRNWMVLLYTVQRGKKGWIQRKSQNAQNECNTMRQSPSYTCGHVHGNRLCPTENKAIQSMRLCDVSCVFFLLSKMRRKKKQMYCFPIFASFFSSRWMSLYAHWLKNTRLTAQITMANDDRVDKKKTESVQHLFK